MGEMLTTMFTMTTLGLRAGAPPSIRAAAGLDLTGRSLGLQHHDGPLHHRCATARGRAEPAPRDSDRLLTRAIDALGLLTHTG